MTHKISKRVFSADFKRKVLETRWKDKLSFKIPPTKDQSIKSDKERIKELEAEIARLKYEMSFYDDLMKEMREIAKPNRDVKKSTNNCHRKIKKKLQ